MNWWKRSQRMTPKDDFDDFFGNTPPPRTLRTDPARTEPVTLTLYRGFDADINKLERRGGGYVLSPAKCEQGVLWFSCPFFQNDAEEVASRGRYTLTYPLVATKHVETTHYESGPPTNHTPDYFLAKTNPSEKSRFHGGYELPDGWAFSYKVQKFIIAERPIVVTPDMIVERGVQ